MGGHRQEEQENHNSSFRRIPIPNPQSPARLQSVTDTTPTLRTRANPSPQESSGPVHPFPTPSISVSRSSRAGIPSQNLKPAAPRPPTPAEAHLVAEAVTAGSSPWHPTTWPRGERTTFLEARPLPWLPRLGGILIHTWLEAEPRRPQSALPAALQWAPSPARPLSP